MKSVYIVYFDTVFVFYCGHGAYDHEGAYCLTSADSYFTGGKISSGTGIDQSELIEHLQRIQAQRLLLIVNACHAGALSPTLGDDFQGEPLPQPTAAAILSTGSGRVIITACRDNQVSYVGDGSLTLFTQALCDGLSGRGTVSRSGYISVFDLYLHLYDNVTETVSRTIDASLREHYGSTSEPELTILKGVGPFPVALFRGASRLGVFPTDNSIPTGAAVREVTPERSP